MRQGKILWVREDRIKIKNGAEWLERKERCSSPSLTDQTHKINTIVRISEVVTRICSVGFWWRHNKCASTVQSYHCK